MAKLVGRVLRFARAGLVAGIVPAAIAILSRGSGRVPAPDTIPLYELLLLYLGAGCFLGILIAVLLPIGRWALGAVAIGILCGFILYSAGMVIVYGVGGYTPGFPVVLGAIMGGPIGFGIWRAAKRDGLIPARVDEEAPTDRGDPNA